MIILSLLTLLIGSLGIYAMARIERASSKSIRRHENLTKPVAHIAVQILQCRRYEKDMFLCLDDSEIFLKYLTKWALAVDVLSARITIYRNHCEQIQQISKAESWLAELNHYQQAVMRVVDDIQTQKIKTPQQANQAMMPHKNTVRTLIVSSFNAFDQEFALASRVDQNLYKQTALIQSVWVTMLLIVIGVSVVAMLIIPSRIVGPIRSLNHVAEKLRDGQMNARVSFVMPDNEVGQLGVVFNQMASELQQRELELSQARDQAEKLNSAKTTFLMNMSHELRTPLTAILGFADLLDKQVTNDESVDAINRSGQHLLRIVDDLLQLTEIETNQFKTYGKTANLKLLIMEVVEKLQPIFDSKQLTVALSGDYPVEQEIYTDLVRLKGILCHILENAAKFTDKGTIQIRCEMSSETQQFIIEIQDTGTGMSVAQLKHAGELFKLGDDSLTRTNSGIGTGLALSKRTLEYMQGKLEIVSEQNVGTCVTITLPVKANLEPAKPAYSNSVEVNSNEVDSQKEIFSGRRRVLVVEDTADLQRLLCSLLKQINVDVDVVENGKLGVDAAMKAKLMDKPYDLILMDMQMPVMDGYAATRQLRRNGYCFPIVAMTAHAMNGDRQKCLYAGCDDYMAKPINPAMFIRYARHWLEHPLIRVI